MTYSIAILGASGYTGAELIRLISEHPSMKIKVKAKNIEIGIPKKEDSDEVYDPIRNGKVSFYDSSKGFGFIIDNENKEK